MSAVFNLYFRSRKVLAAIPALLVGGCVVGPNYQPPQTQFRPAYQELTTSANASGPAQASKPIAGVGAVERWWMSFQDPQLDALVARAVKGNVDLKLAISRVREVRAQRGMIVASALPQVNAGGSYMVAQGSKNVSSAMGAALASSGGASGGGGSGSRAGPSPGAALPAGTLNLYQAGFDASWEWDIFGGTHRALEEADALIGAAEEGRRAVLVSLLGEVATTYMELRSTQQRLQIARDNLQSQRETLGITEAKFKAGFVTEIDFSRQSAEVAATAAIIPSIEAAEHDAVHSLAFLVGEDPNELGNELSEHSVLPPIPPQVPVGLPSDLLLRRPDLRQAERRLAAATAQIGVVTADLYPKFNLASGLGLSSTTARKLPEWNSHYDLLTGGLSWPILDWGKVRNSIHVQNERQQQALLTYENTVSQALREVEDALVHYQKEQERRAALSDAVTQSRITFDVARQSYEHGLVDQLVILDAQRQLLSAQSNLAQSEGAVRTNLISLYKALGGGWEM